MKRVLIISYYWPPAGGSGVQRWVKFAKYLPAEGWQPVVYTPENPEQIATDNSLMQDIPDEAEIIRTRITEPYAVYRRLLKTSGHSEKAIEVNPVNAQDKTFIQKAAMWIRGNLFRPDPRCLWIRPSVRFLKKYLKEHPVDLIVSTGPPHSVHLIGERVAQATATPWIADFRDPWTKIFYFKHLSMTRMTEKWHLKTEKRILDRADMVVAVSPTVQQDFQLMTQTPVELVTNGFDECDFQKDRCEDAAGGKGKDFIITHTGLFAADGDPSVLWEVLSEMCSTDSDFKKALKIRLAGKTDRQITDSIASAGLRENLQDLGYITHAEAVEEQTRASLLILPLRKEPEYKAVLPGKLFEYLAAWRPVLGIGQTDGAMSMILNQTKAGVVFNWNDKESVAKFMKLCWERHREGTLKVEDADIGRFSRKRLTRQMAELFEKVIRMHQRQTIENN